jgi:hypothetical protein
MDNENRPGRPGLSAEKIPRFFAMVWYSLSITLDHGIISAGARLPVEPCASAPGGRTRTSSVRQARDGSQIALTISATEAIRLRASTPCPEQGTGTDDPQGTRGCRFPARTGKHYLAFDGRSSPVMPAQRPGQAGVRGKETEPGNPGPRARPETGYD